MGTVRLSIDGNCGCALLGENLQEGEAEFVCADDAPAQYTGTQRFKWACTQAFRALEKRLDKRLGYAWCFE